MGYSGKDNLVQNILNNSTMLGDPDLTRCLRSQDEIDPLSFIKTILSQASHLKDELCNLFK